MTKLLPKKFIFNIKKTIFDLFYHSACCKYCFECGNLLNLLILSSFFACQFENDCNDNSNRNCEE